MQLKGQKALIINICPSDKPLVEIATRLGIELFATSSVDDSTENKKIRQLFPNIEILILPTAFQTKLSTKKNRLENDKKIKCFMKKNRVENILRTARYLETNNLNLKITNKFPFLESIFPSLGLHWNKALYLKKLIKSGVLVPQIHSVNPDNKILPNLKNIKFPCICKPAYCTGGYGVFIAKNTDDICRLFSLETSPESFSPLNLYYRNKVNGCLRNYIYSTGQFSGSYIIQEYLQGRVISASGVIANNKINNVFSYEIHSTENSFCAEQGFSWPVEGLDENVLLNACSNLTKALNYPSGPFMIDFILTEKNELYVIDAGPRASLTGAQLSSFVFDNNHHLEAQLLSHWNISSPNLSQNGRPIFWQRFPFPKGQIKKISYPNFTEPWVVFAENLLSENDFVFEARLDRQMIERGSMATTGSSFHESKLNWQNKFQEIQWTII